MPITTFEKIVTPQDAESMLKSNTSNRPVKKSTVDAYAHMMKNGDWAMSTDVIAFDVNGTLINGQHRLIACVKSNTPFPALIGVGYDPSAYEVIDQCVVRTARDIGKDDAPWVKSTIGISTVRFILSVCGMFHINGGSRLTPKMSIELSRKYSGIAHCAYNIGNRKHAVRDTVTISAIISAMCNGEDLDAIDQFIDVSRNNIETSNGRNVRAALDYFDARKIARQYGERARGRVYEEAMIALYKFIHNTKRCTKKDVYPITIEMIDDLNIKLIEKYEREARTNV